MWGGGVDYSVMKVWLRRVAICLILSVITTIAVAWICAAWVDLEDSAMHRVSISEHEAMQPLTCPELAQSRDSLVERIGLWIERVQDM